MNLSKSVIATVLFSSNILFWRQSWYFNAQMDLIPLLHTWSLAVEEQFYILFPPALAVLYRLGRSKACPDHCRAGHCVVPAQRVERAEGTVIRVLHGSDPRLGAIDRLAACTRILPSAQKQGLA